MRLSVLNKIKKAPREPGVYIFYGKNKKALYVGKASDLRARLKNYLKTDDYKINLLQNEAESLKLIVLRSEIEALLEESRLIKTFRPSYNIMWRDDKSYFYVAVTKEKFPRIFVTHRFRNSKLEIKNFELIGPFTDGRSLRVALRLLRRKFPYCTCETSHFRNCLNAEIGNCLGFCCKKDIEPTKKEIERYRRNIRIIKIFLLGKSKARIFKELLPEEQKAIDNILAHREFIAFVTTDKSMVKSQWSNVALTECYDISHLSGKEAVGAMTAWCGNVADKSMWRKFKIKTAKPGDDPGAISEILTRRLNHPEWPYPNLIIIDGGITQLNAAQRALNQIPNSKFQIPTKIISFAKPEKLVLGWRDTKATPIQEIPPDLQKLILKAIAETHNFAIRYHRKVRRSQFP
ncbi:hypothetical protein A3A20_00625 [Candidatus Wolfebacteria bacterium RIFCSPLOWO2_01_FULL_45_19]|uniref:Excinuclease ABC subunit C n=1 Tax=Candidatus Wolfebacteria bacterium RIFCSPLOWO2_01_FULL_45_19 TaxID=1802557 RepID=A0A1F8DR28_9BACT|nr:MAG: Excinuclease ABC, C subunit [Parcubacteria group bacterium GW2011_GWB1_45_9]OGM91083.1 MAG: hypothetical protein A3A20_00625 [Candidatus Wolfebacteria bacterium RIFCSPLOWO2_01_FULL_45_19]